MHFAVQNLSTLVKDSDAELMAEAVAKQLLSDAAPAWLRTPAQVAFIPKMRAIDKSAILCILFDHADQAGALGYHDETPDGLQFARIFVKPVLDSGGTALKASTPQQVTVASVLSHEVLEAFVDPACNAWCDGPLKVAKKKYAAVALEVGDPVEAGSYDVTTASGAVVTVSDFVHPAWFDPKAPAGSRFNQLATLTAPMTMTQGGYLIVRNAAGKESQVFGEFRPKWRAKAKPKKTSRAGFRGA